ncbi:MAG: hypothetical protein DUD28_00270 [Lactobacillus sp.]|nr:MAG: hypothetical protein DUD28_00270 [Lactobacillus sp.]
MYQKFLMLRSIAILVAKTVPQATWRLIKFIVIAYFLKIINVIIIKNDSTTAPKKHPPVF